MHPTATTLTSFAILCALLVAPTDAMALKLATWNLEHLADSDGEGCRPRTQPDYQALKRHADLLNADIIAVQEVENEQALARIFDPDVWSFEIARNPDQETSRDCAGLPGKHIITQRTGFAIKKTIRYSRNPDMAQLDIGGKNRHRFGVDVTIEAGYPLRLLAVHLKSGCPIEPPTSDNDDCKVLFQQQKVLKTWVNERAQDQIPFAILGDFNRRLQNEEDFWTGLDAPGDAARDLTLSVSRDAITRCRSQFSQFIDFIVFAPTSLPFLKANSFEELIYSGPPASDHCPVAVEVTIPDFRDLAPKAREISAGLKWFRRSAEFPLITRFIYGQAARRVNAIKSELRDSVPWIVSLDADETILDNSLGQLENEYLGLGYVAERWKRWEARGAAKEIPGAIDFMNHVLRSGGRIAVITNRDVEFETATRENLIRLGLHDDRRTVCVLGRREVDTQVGNPDEWQRYGYKNDKDRRRRLLREGNAVGCWANDADGSLKATWNRPHRIALWIGDNILDLPATKQDDARLQGTPGLVFGQDYFLLPNPLYGSWQNNKP